MQVYEILGIKISQFEKDGQIIKYCKLFVAYLDDKTDGRACEAISVKPEVVEGFNVGEKIYLYYNRFGKVTGIKAL